MAMDEFLLPELNRLHAEGFRGEIEFGPVIISFKDREHEKPATPQA